MFIHNRISTLLSASVPEYEITEPYQSNKHGDFVSHTLHRRHTRDVHDEDAWHYRMDAFWKENASKTEAKHATGKTRPLPGNEGRKR